ncbi:MAG TPA: hypothetical protein VMF51_17290 [Nocardioides sp.]|uniref:hypothetical protein n=1 Tax=Nocardioides sp. TaxID=35761 RepID=UPI002D055402|nr:hypothetical protein [Nocardioides sp.]HTW16889.1 hypothetical protein [Nocardioides sp.]
MSLTARINHLQDVATGIGWKVVRTVAPVISDLAGKAQSTLRSRLPGQPPAGGTAPAEPPVVESTPDPGPPVEAPAVTKKASTGPSPASVARNIAPHPPAPVTAPPKPSVPRRAPGAKLPPRRRTDED